jgi:hypothetical protein
MIVVAVYLQVVLEAFSYQDLHHLTYLRCFLPRVLSELGPGFGDDTVERVVIIWAVPLLFRDDCCGGMSAGVGEVSEVIVANVWDSSCFVTL